jgi:large subunit ribosomal protein L53
MLIATGTFRPQILQHIHHQPSLPAFPPRLSHFSILQAILDWSDQRTRAPVSSVMQTRYLTSVTTRFNPFRQRAKPCRLFLSLLPPNARSIMKINTKVLPRESKESSLLEVTFSPSPYAALDSPVANVISQRMEKS